MFYQCPQCKNWFVRDAPWKRICLDCYKVNKRAEKLEAEYQARLEQLRYEAEAARQRQNTYTISNELLKKLIMLCHPDKHNGSNMSVEVTQQLLGMRK